MCLEIAYFVLRFNVVYLEIINFVLCFVMCFGNSLVCCVICDVFTNVPCVVVYVVCNGHRNNVFI